MKKVIVSIAAVALVVGQASVAFAATKDAPVVTKASMTSCVVPTKATKLAKAPRVENRCDMEEHHVGSTPLIFGGVIAGGIIAAYVITTDNNSATSP